MRWACSLLSSSSLLLSSHLPMEGDALLPKPKMPAPAARLVSAQRYLVGVTLLLIVVLLWTASNFITNALETGDDHWNKPFLITYLNTSSFAVYLIPAAWRYYRRGNLGQGTASERGYQPVSDLPVSPRTSLTIPGSPRAPLQTLEEIEEPTIDAPHDTKLTVRETAEIAAWWSAVWFLANWSLNAALAFASVASVTILSSVTSFFTLSLGRVFGVEDVTRAKVFSALASFIGVVLVTRSDSGIHATTGTNIPTHPILGDVLSLLSAAFYSIYVILLKVRIRDESRVDTQLMLGFAGLYNIICLLPAFPILHYLGWETFEFPPTGAAWAIIVANMLITLSSDYLYVLAMLKTTPLLVTIGLSLTIPFALLGSLVIPSASAESITFLTLLGAGLVVGSFLVLGWKGWEDSNSPELELEDERER